MSEYRTNLTLEYLIIRAKRQHEQGMGNIPYTIEFAYVEDLFYVIQSLEERIKVRDVALAWYEELGSSLHRYMVNKPPQTDAMMAVMTQLSLDEGKRAKTALEL